MPHSTRLGIAETRRRLPELIEEAHHGGETIITKRGKPYATLVSAQNTRRRRFKRRTLLSLEGSGWGLWGNVRTHVEGLRNEWD